MSDATNLGKVVQRFEGLRVAVYGDLVADEFVYGRGNRISREAPVLILDHICSEILPGGGANSLNNLVAFGARVSAVGVIGDDAPGQALRTVLEHRGIDLSGLLTLPEHATPTKTRILGGAPHSVQQQIVRVDRGEAVAPEALSSSQLSAALERLLPDVDGLLIADYGYGTVREDVAASAIARVRNTGGVVTVDSRHGLDRFPGCTAATPNQEEAEGLLGEPIATEMSQLSRQGERLRRLLRCDAILLTLGSRGMALFEEGREVEALPIHGTEEVADVTGAGDTVISALTLSLLAGADLRLAARLANVAAGLVVMKRGTATVSRSELESALATLSSQG